jgi:hypothetical protein
MGGGRGKTTSNLPHKRFGIAACRNIHFHPCPMPLRADEWNAVPVGTGDRIVVSTDISHRSCREKRPRQ